MRFHFKKMFEDGKCPMLESDVIKRYKLSDQFVKNFCNKGCSVECGKFLREELNRAGMLQVDGQISLTDIPGVMP